MRHLKNWVCVLFASAIFVCVVRPWYSRIMAQIGKPHKSNATVISGYKNFPDVAFYMRTTSMQKDMVQRLYCILLRSAIFFWPGRYGNMVLVLDENEAEHTFAQKFQKQMKENFPEWTLNVYYEGLPGNKTIEFEDMQRNLGYNRQLYNTFFLDKYTNNSIIAYVDTDAQFHTPHTKEYLFDKTTKKLLVIGQDIVIDENLEGMTLWKQSTEKALGLKVISCFMVTFPEMIYRDTVINTRNYILKRFNTTNFDYALRQFFGPGTNLSPINIMMHYAWYFEKERYSWHINMKNTTQVNAGLPKAHRITPQDMIPCVVGALHEKNFKPGLFIAGYCETMRGIGKPVPGCKGIVHNPNTFCKFFHTSWPDSMKTWCKQGTENSCCREAAQEHYQGVARIPPDFHTFNKTRIKQVEALAVESGVKCPTLVLP